MKCNTMQHSSRYEEELVVTCPSCKTPAQGPPGLDASLPHISCTNACRSKQLSSPPREHGLIVPCRTRNDGVLALLEHRKSGSLCIDGPPAIGVSGVRLQIIAAVELVRKHTRTLINTRRTSHVTRHKSHVTRHRAAIACSGFMSLRGSLCHRLARMSDLNCHASSDKASRGSGHIVT
jgi:hypothetical protein